VQQILTEVRGHLEDSYGELLDAGAADDEAAREAEVRFGRPEVVARAYHNILLERTRDGSHGAPPRRPPGERLTRENIMSALLRDLRFALRGLRRAPGYTLAFVLTLGLGIGANSAIFSVVNGVLLRPLPYRDGHELVYLRQSAPLAGLDNALFSVPEIREYQEQVAAFSGVADFSSMEFTLLGFDEPREVIAGVVNGGYFEVMGLEAELGRVIQPSDDGGEAEPVMVLTHDYWMSAFGGDPAVVGTDVQMNGRSIPIIGVAAPAPPYPEETDIYVNVVTSPHHLGATMRTDRAHRMTEVFGRLAPGATLEEARSEVQQVATQGYAAYPESYDDTAGYSVTVTPLQRQLAARARTVLLLLLGAAGFVLLLACANVANLTLARVLRRRDELAVRVSLGAGGGALRRQLLMENLVPSLIGAAFGLLVARLGLDALTQYAARYSVRAGEIRLDATVFAVTLIIGVGAACLFALIPRLPTATPRSAGRAAAIRHARATAGVAGRNLQRALVVVQVAVCFVLLIGAGLLLRTLLNLNSTDGGFELDTVLTVEVPTTFGRRTNAEDRQFYETVVERAAALPGVSHAALGTRVPLVGAPDGLGAILANLEFDIDGVAAEPGQPPRADYRVVTPGYFDTLGMEVVQGRGFAATDSAEAPLAVIINEAMARRYFPDRDPVGQRIRWSDDILRIIGIDPGYRTVIGVVSDTNDFGITNPVPDVVFQPFAQSPDAAVLFVRSTRPAAVARPVVELIHDIDPEQPVERVATLAQVRADAIAPQRLNATLLSAFAALAVVIAAVGVAGVLAFSVSQRRREIGVRAALGADRRRLVAAVMSEGMLMVVLGLVVGTTVAAGLSRLVAGLLFGVAPIDAATFAAVAATLLLIAALAAWIPARRAARIDPVAALRAD
jgi:predicted permease